MTRLRAIGRGVRDFVIGDDPLLAAGVVMALAATGAVAALGVTSWWVLPVAVPILLGGSLWRQARRAQAGGMRDAGRA
jgi:hypothetical protein